MKFLLPAFVCLTALPAHAQGLNGEDTPSNWRVTHTERFGIWESLCDERTEPAGLHQRCYIRHVDVFSPRPAFGALFTFVHRPKGTLEVEFGLEPGTLFGPNGFRIEKDGAVMWRTRRPGCLTGVSCTFAEEAAQEVIGVMAAGGAVRLEFRDRHGAAQDLTWPLEGFAAALADFESESAKRNIQAGG
ncbi:hypothetical protein [Pacificoceanicola onchidii]|uniref:hypothetical protein n=1 Tax=Pacificoceanicola onchidii TaxID=2562685 RepID=UPI0010A59AFD|nr:hypothetical protein [Pacificoceanicola onchidii]